MLHLFDTVKFELDSAAFARARSRAPEILIEELCDDVGGLINAGSNNVGWRDRR